MKKFFLVASAAIIVTNCATPHAGGGSFNGTGAPLSEGMTSAQVEAIRGTPATIKRDRGVVCRAYDNGFWSSGGFTQAFFVNDIVVGWEQSPTGNCHIHNDYGANQK